MKVALHSNDLSADGISFTPSINRGFVEDTVVELICALDAVSVSDRLDTVKVQQIVILKPMSNNIKIGRFLSSD